MKTLWKQEQSSEKTKNQSHKSVRNVTSVYNKTLFIDQNW